MQAIGLETYLVIEGWNIDLRDEVNEHFKF